MAWSARKRSQIRDDYLADLAARSELAGDPLDVGEGSYDFRLGESLALILESQEAQAQNNTNEILPDKASETGVARHADVDGVPREEATKAILQVTITGTASQTVTFGSSRLTSPSGLSYISSANADGTGASVVLSGGGTATVYATCQTTGTEGNLAVGTTLAWSSTPTNANPTATVVPGGTPAQDQESKDSWALRILEERRERPVGNTRAAGRSWAQAVNGVYEAFIYPLWHQVYGPNTRGAVTIVIVGPPQGPNPLNTRILDVGSTDDTDRVEGYIEGANDTEGTATPNGTQLRDVGLEAGSYVALPAIEVVKDITIVLTMASNAPFPWTSPASYTVTAWNPTTKEITLSADPANVEEGDTIALRDLGVRGFYSYGKVIGVNHGTNKVTMESEFSPAMVDTAASGRIRPAPPTATSIRDAVFTYTDSMTPGDTSPPSRWPIIDKDRPSVLFVQAVASAAIANSGGSVLSAVTTLPASDQTPAPRQLFALGELILQSA